MIGTNSNHFFKFILYKSYICCVCVENGSVDFVATGKSERVEILCGLEDTTGPFRGTAYSPNDASRMPGGVRFYRGHIKPSNAAHFH